MWNLEDNSLKYAGKGSLCWSLCVYVFDVETGSCYEIKAGPNLTVTHAGLKLSELFLPQSPKCWDYRNKMEVVFFFWYRGSNLGPSASGFKAGARTTELNPRPKKLFFLKNICQIYLIKNLKIIKLPPKMFESEDSTDEELLINESGSHSEPEDDFSELSEEFHSETEASHHSENLLRLIWKIQSLLCLSFCAPVHLV